MSVCPCVRKTRQILMNFSKRVLRNYVGKLRLWLKSYKNSWNFILRPAYVFYFGGGGPYLDSIADTYENKQFQKWLQRKIKFILHVQRAHKIPVPLSIVCFNKTKINLYATTRNSHNFS
jgi:hypothetical protein